MCIEFSSNDIASFAVLLFVASSNPVGMEHTMSWTSLIFPLYIPAVGRITEAASILDACSPSSFQPIWVIDLFSEHRDAWISYRAATSSATVEWSPKIKLNVQGARSSLDVPQDDEYLHGNEDNGSHLSSTEINKDQRTAIVAYLFRAREFPGVEHTDGVDTLLMNLLTDLDEKEQASAFAAVPNHVIIDLVSEKLLRLRWKHALATLYAAQGIADVALEMWQDVALSNSASVPSTEWWESLQGSLSLVRDVRTCSIETAMRHIPWLLKKSPSHLVADAVAHRDDAPPDIILPLLDNGTDVRWMYLDLLVGGNAVSVYRNDRDLHTEYVRALIAAVLSKAPELKRTSMTYNEKEQEHLCQRIEGTERQGREPVASNGSLDSIVALVEGGGDDDDDVEEKEDLTHRSGNVPCMRKRLRRFLVKSTLWNVKAITELLQHSMLYRELVIVHWKQGNHVQALRLLVFAMHDVPCAVVYAKRYLLPEQHAILLSLILNPVDAREKIVWEDAVYVVATLGGSLDPMEVLRSMPTEMSIASACPLLFPLLRERIGRHRFARMSIAMHRAQGTRYLFERFEEEEEKIFVDEERTCQSCGLRMGIKVFVAMPRQEIEHATTRHENEIRVSGVHNKTGERDVVCFNCFEAIRKVSEQ